MMNPIEVENLYFKYEEDGKEIFNSLNLTVKKGEILAIIGESGSGKSTLLNILCGIIPHIKKGKVQGKVRLFGKDVKEMEIREITKRVGIVFQDPDSQLFLPTVEDEIAFGPENLMVSREEIGLRIDKALKAVNMEEYRFENPNNLSGGQKQLIAIGAVLAMEPDILLFDEIMSQVDEEGKEKLKDTIVKLSNEQKTIVLVEHDLKVLKIAQRVLELKNGRLQDFKGW